MTILGAVFYSLTGISSSDVREFTNNIQNGVPLFQLPQISTNGSGVTSTPYGQAYFGTANDPHFKDPYSIQWNLSVERDLGWNTGLRVSYIALRSVQLPWAPELNQPQTSHHSLRAAASHRPAVPVLGPYQYARYRRQRDLQLAADRADPTACVAV